MSFDPAIARDNVANIETNLVNPKPVKPPLVGLNISELLAKEFPPRENLLAPWLPQQGLAQVYAYRGVGKTHFALGVAVAVASGGKYLKWQAPKPRRVVYIDGEMPAITIQERLGLIIKAEGAEFEPTNLVVVNPDLQQLGMPDLATHEGQIELKRFTDDADLIIIDNISTLCRAGTENKADDWQIVQEWALKMRSKGKSILFVHHAGKGGAQRGTSKREDVLDSVIALRQPKDYAADKGAEFEVHFEKSRGIAGDDVAPFVAGLSIIDGVQSWTMKSLELRTYDQVVMLANEGLKQHEIAEELGVNKSQVSRHLRKARGVGDVSK